MVKGIHQRQCGCCDDGSNNGSHGNTAVLALDGTTAFEGLGFGFEPSKRIEDTEGFGDTELKLVHHLKLGGATGNRGGGEGGGGASEEGGKCELHFYLLVNENLSNRVKKK